MSKQSKNTPVRTTPLPWELPGAHYLDDEELTSVTKVMRAKSLFRFYGPDLQHTVSDLEEHFKSAIHRQFALAVNSGTSALHVALIALNVGPGDEVLVPGYLWVSCVSAIIRTGAIPRLVDIDDSFCMSAEDLERKINARSKVILYIHMSGAMGDIPRILDIAQKNKVKILEDCAQVVGATLNGKPAGAFGDIAIYSFQLNKNMTSGEGGMIVCDDHHLYQRCFAAHDLGYARTGAGRLDPHNDELQLWGIGARMSELTGAVALIQFKKLKTIVAAMNHSKLRIIEQIKNIPKLVFRKIFDYEGDSGAFLIITFPDETYCRRFVAGLQDEGIKGPKDSVACVVLGDVDFYWYYNTPSLVYKRSNSSDNFPWSHPANQFAEEIDYHKGLLPNCDNLSGKSMKLAIASNLSTQDEDDIIAAFHKVSQLLG